MSAILPDVSVQEASNYTPRLLTAADVAVLPDQLPSGAVAYELHYGKLIIMVPPSDLHGAIECVFSSALMVQGHLAGHGKARCGDVGILLARNPDHLLGADALFICNTRLPIRHSPEGYLLTMPDLVVEVRSKNDSIPDTVRKANEYLSAGVRVVWVPDPFTRTVTEHRMGAEPVYYTEDDALTIEDVIPNFRLAVADVFRE